METITKVGRGPGAISSLVIGTESKRLLILDPVATKMMCSVDLGGVPVHMAVSGEFDTEWRIVVACRDGKLYTVTNGSGKSSLHYVAEVGLMSAFLLPTPCPRTNVHP